MSRLLRLLGATVPALLLAAGPTIAANRLKVAASITDLASIAASVGGDHVEVFSIARPNADVHHIEVLPSYMVKVSRADVYLKVGMQLDPWADGIIDGSRNRNVKVVDCGRDIVPLEKPSAVNASMGDVHPFGNPHYWLDPRNGGIVAKEIAQGLAEKDPAHAQEYAANAATFARAAQADWERNRAVADALPVKTVITYHASWIYFSNAFGLEIAGTAEPVPGIPPTAKHLDELVNLAKSRHVPVLLQEPYFSDDAGRFLARETGLRVVKASPSCDTAEAGSYLAHFDAVMKLLAAPAANP